MGFLYVLLGSTAYILSLRQRPHQLIPQTVQLLFHLFGIELIFWRRWRIHRVDFGLSVRFLLLVFVLRVDRHDRVSPKNDVRRLMKFVLYMGLEKTLSSGVKHSCAGREKYCINTHKKSPGCLLMLLQLSVRDFAIAEQIDLQFEPGMTVISGETGAGKSILLD